MAGLPFLVYCALSETIVVAIESFSCSLVDHSLAGMPCFHKCVCQPFLRGGNSPATLLNVSAALSGYGSCKHWLLDHQQRLAFIPLHKRNASLHKLQVEQNGAPSSCDVGVCHRRTTTAQMNSTRGVDTYLAVPVHTVGCLPSRCSGGGAKRHDTPPSNHNNHLPKMQVQTQARTITSQICNRGSI